jgi:hypothetical protein
MDTTKSEHIKTNAEQHSICPIFAGDAYGKLEASWPLCNLDNASSNMDRRIGFLPIEPFESSLLVPCPPVETTPAQLQQYKNLH